MDRAVREIRVTREEGKRSTVVVKVYELSIHKDRIHRRLRNIETLIDRKPVDRQLSIVQNISLIRYILSLNKIDYSVRYNQINNITNIILFQNYTITVSTSSIFCVTK